jgi:hypothetical protein
MSHAGHNPNEGRRRAPRRPCRGGTTIGLLVTISLIGALAATAVIVTPAYLHASSSARPEPVIARLPAHQQMIELLGSLVSRSREVLAVHQRQASPYLELVLWLEDGANPGRIDPAEVAVITHSEVLRTISFFGLKEADASDEAQPAKAAGWVDEPSDIGSASFCAAWRSRPDVRQRVLGSSVATMEVEPLTDAGDGRALLRISLTWAPDLVDGPDEASVLVDVLMRPQKRGMRE